MKPDDSYDMPLDIIRLSDEVSDDAAQQLASYRNKALMLLISWRTNFDTNEANKDYQLEDGENIKLRSSNPSQLLAEQMLPDSTRIRYDYDESRVKDKLIVTAYEASGEVLAVSGNLADMYDQLAGLLFICGAIEIER